MKPQAAQQPLPQLPNAPALPPVFGAQPAGTAQKPKAKSQNTTFLGANATANPAGGTGKSLLGQ